MTQRAVLIEGKTSQGFIVSREGVLTGDAIHKAQPHYPPEAKFKRISGSVSVKIDIDETGAVTDAKIICGGGMLAEVSREAALEWRFKRSILNGQPVKVRGILTFNFTLE